jgi:hypothetical protein
MRLRWPLVRTLLVLTLAVCGASTFAEAEPVATVPADVDVLPLPPHSATYEVLRRGTKLGTLEIELWLDNGGVYEYRAETSATHFMARMLGIGASERGRFLWQNGAIQPIFYEQHINRPGPDRYWHANFDWVDLVATGRSHRGQFSTQLEPDTVDPLTQRLQLAVWLNDPDAQRDEYEFWVIDRDELERQVFVRREEFTFEFDVGCVQAVHFEQQEDDPARGDHSWVAPALYWLPVRWQQIREGREQLEVRLSSTTLPLDDHACDTVAGPTRR